MHASPALRISLQATLLLGLGGWSTAALADYNVTCESRDNRHQTCRLDQAGYVTLDRNLSNQDCRQGRNWDYDRREIWVDDGCRATFKVHTYGGSSHGSSKVNDHDAKVAAGVLIGAAIIGAMAHHADKDDERYRDDGYYGSRHASYVPGWMVGRFEGYNPVYGADVRMTIEDDGQVSVAARGQTLRGWINSGELHVGSEVFTINRSGDGFVTSQVGDAYNEVRYHRAD